jgi:hypothetical protein
MFGRHNSTLRPIADTGAPRSLTNKKGISSTIFRKSRAHFTVRKLERRYGRVAAQRAYERHPRPPDPLPQVLGIDAPRKRKSLSAAIIDHLGTRIDYRRAAADADRSRIRGGIGSIAPDVIVASGSTSVAALL